MNSKLSHDAEPTVTIDERSFEFALNIIELYKHLSSNKEYIISTRSHALRGNARGERSAFNYGMIRTLAMELGSSDILKRNVKRKTIQLRRREIITEHPKCGVFGFKSN